MESVRQYEGRSLEVADGFPRYHDWLMRQLAPHIHGRVVELGAGVGTVADRWIDLAETAILIEPAMNLHAKLVTRFTNKPRVHVLGQLLDEAVREHPELLRAGSIDTALLVNVLEHIDDDVGVLRTLYSLLKPGGKLVIFVPALQQLYGVLDERALHLRRYNRKSLTHPVEAAGFSIETLRYFDFLGMGAWFVTGRVLRREAVDDASGKTYDRFIVPVCEWVDKKVGPRVGKNLICIARKS